MINFKIAIENPWNNKKWENYKCWSWVLFSTRVLEIQLHRTGHEIFSFMIDTMWRGRDHAGPELEITLLGKTMTIKIYDTRHWDYNNNKWETKGIV